MADLEKIGRLALRREGNLWNAYYAVPDTMEGAVFLGSIVMAAVENSERKQEFMTLMRQVVGDIIEEKIGIRPEWPNEPELAPEHERSGHG